MRGADVFQESLFTTVQLETFVPTDHPLRAVKALLDEAMENMNWLFESIYCDTGRESIPPERLIRAQLLQVLYSIRSERQLVEQINYNLLYRWFVGLTIEDRVWNHSTFSINRDRLLEHNVVGELFEQVLSLANTRELLSLEHRIFMEKNAVIPLMNPKPIVMLEWRKRGRERKRSWLTWGTR